ncbi:MAG TPA: glycosyltransferase family 9 protein [Terriglobales bacterium]
MNTPTGITSLLIVRLSAMGDIIHTLPAASALRDAFPEAVIGWVVEERWAELLCSMRVPRSGPRSPQRPLADKIHTANTAVWRSSLTSTRTWEQIAAGLSDLRAARYQVAVDFQGAVRSALVARWSGAQTLFGVAQPRENAASMFYTRQIIAKGTHIVEQNFSLAEAVVGHAMDYPQVEFPFDESAEHSINRELTARSIREFAILNPGAGWGAKQWPPARFGLVARDLAKDGIRSLINFGPGEEDLVREAEASSDGAAQGIACSISELISYTRRARLFVGGDTGPMHLAAALGVPVVGIFGPTNPARNGPFGTRSIVLRSPSSTTTHARHKQPEEGLLEITVDDVLIAARRLLGRTSG